MPVDAAQIRLEEKLKLRYRRWGFTVCFSKKDYRNHSGAGALV